MTLSKIEGEGWKRLLVFCKIGETMSISKLDFIYNTEKKLMDIILFIKIKFRLSVLLWDLMNSCFSTGQVEYDRVCGLAMLPLRKLTKATA